MSDGGESQIEMGYKRDLENKFPFFWDTLSVLYSVQTGEQCIDLQDECLLKQII